MATRAELYNSAYSNYEAEVYREIRRATYGEDFGQTSWVSNEESHSIPRLLGLTGESNVLEIGCGSGRYALHLAATTGCQLLGLDINDFAIKNANRLAQQSGLSARAQFMRCDVSKRLPFDGGIFDAVFSNDVICHIPERPSLFHEISRILKPGGKLLFSDALVVGGAVSHEEIATRSSIGYYIFTPPGENERLLAEAGFKIQIAADTTANAAEIAAKWRDAREKHRDKLIAIEASDNFAGLQKFLDCVYQLNTDKRLLRILYLAEKIQ